MKISLCVSGGSMDAFFFLFFFIIYIFQSYSSNLKGIEMRYDVTPSIRKYKGVGENTYLSVWVCQKMLPRRKGMKPKAEQAYYKVYNWDYISTLGRRASRVEGLWN